MCVRHSDRQKRICECVELGEWNVEQARRGWLISQFFFVVSDFGLARLFPHDQHDSSVKELSYCSERQVLISGSWDRTVRFWDIRSNGAFQVANLPDRCYALGVPSSLSVCLCLNSALVSFCFGATDSYGTQVLIGTAERHVLLFDIRSLTKPIVCV